MVLKPDVIKKFEFDWQIIDVIVGGKSAIDSATSLLLKSSDEAAKFLECYGYDLENPIEKAELFGNFQEAISFIRRYFLKPENPDGLELEIPRRIVEITDITQLIMLASAPASGVLSHWACAVIKIMHTIAHMDRDLFGSYYFSDIQKQILDRFYKFIHSDENGKIFLGKDLKDSEKIEILLFESKPKKSRDSVILKLLHKPENVAEDIFDRVGIRFVTYTKFDSLRVIKFLKERYVIMPANIKPSRSRNTLIDTENLTESLNKYLKMADDNKFDSANLDQKINELIEKKLPKIKEKENPYSSQEYRSIQFTGRQLIKLKNHYYDDLKNLKQTAKGKTMPEEVMSAIDKIELKGIQKETRFFYPFEVQVYDEISHKENLAGMSSHVNYKKNQVKAAMKRVMGHMDEKNKN